MRRFFRWGLAAQVAVVASISACAWLGALPRAIAVVPGYDLVIHALLFGLVAFFLDGALGFRRLFPSAPFPRLAPVAVLAAAGVEELAQGLSARRSSSLADFAADVAGVCAFAWLSKRLSGALRSGAAG